MTNLKPEITKKQNLALDEQLLAELQKIGIIETKYDLSKLCGKNNSYYSCMRKRQYGLHVGSLILLAARLAKRIDETEDVVKRAQLRTGLHAVHEAIAEKCRLRELELNMQRAG